MDRLPLLLNPEPAAAHPSYDTVRSLTAAWGSSGGRVYTSKYPSRISKKLFAGRPTLELRGAPAVLIPLMGPRFDWIPRRKDLAGAEVYLHCWDVFESNDSAWDAIFAEVQPRIVTMTSRNAAARWRERGLNSHWLPEAINPEMFPSKVARLDERQIDVLELGRKWDSLHAKIAPTLASAGYSHLYQRDATTPIFPSLDTFVEGICNSKTVICVPGARTHPVRFGNDAIITMRYLESMASGALPVGEMPDDLISLAGYNPGVDLIGSDPAESLLGVVRDISAYSDLVARNRESVRQWGSWLVRITQYSELIN